MLKFVFLIPMLLVTFSIANVNNQVIYENITKQENTLLKLKLKVYELKEKNSELQKIIDNFKVDEKKNLEREKAIVQLRKDLEMSRRNHSQALRLLH